MRMRLLVVLSLAVVAHSAGASKLSTEQSALEECKAYSQAKLRQCLMRKSRDSTTALKRAEDQMLAAISKWDEDERYVTPAKADLAASRRAFDQYRQAQCAFASSLGGGAIGNALELRRLACVLALNNDRAALLVSAAAALPPR